MRSRNDPRGESNRIESNRATTTTATARGIERRDGRVASKRAEKRVERTRRERRGASEAVDGESW